MTRSTALWLGILLAADPGLSGQDTPPTARPGARHELLKEFEGTWEAHGKFSPEPGKPAVESRLTMTSTLTCQGRWLAYSTTGDIGGDPYEGRGLLGYSEPKGKYVDCYVDVLSKGVDLYEGTWDDVRRTLTMVSDSTDAQGNPMRVKFVVELKDKDTQIHSSYEGAPGQEALAGTWEFKRRR